MEPSTIACYREGERLGDDTSGDLNVLSLLGAPESWYHQPVKYPPFINPDFTLNLILFPTLSPPTPHRSFPGVLDTVVNIGLNDQIVEHLSFSTGKRFALHTYAHFLFRFACTILNATPEHYHRVLQEIAG